MKKAQERYIKELIHKAESGDVKAAFKLYEDYHDGTAQVEQDDKLAQEYATQVARLFNGLIVLISSLQFTSFRAFKSLEIDYLNRRNDENRKLTVIVGVNGSGKTSILDAIAYSLSWLALRISKQSNSGKGESVDEHDIHRSRTELSEYASLIVDFKLDANLFYTLELTKPHKDSNGSRKNYIEEISKLGRLYRLVNKMDANFNMPIMAYYGVDRTIEFTKKQLNNIVGDIGDSESKFDGYKNGLKAKVDFPSFFKWFKYQVDLCNLGEDIRYKESKARAEKSVSLVNKAISAAMPGFEKLRVELIPYIDLVIDKNGLSLSVSQLSQGEKSLLTLVIDIARRLILLNPDNSQGTPLDGTGVVLIDEIDLHLHPKWQQIVIPSLRSTFSNIQFIVTTHSPQVISTVPSECILLLDNGQVFSVPPGTQGAESSRLLKQILGVDPRPEEDEFTIKLNSYLASVYDDKWNEDSVLRERKELDAHFEGIEPELIKADLYIENRKWELDIEKDQ